VPITDNIIKILHKQQNKQKQDRWHVRKEYKELNLVVCRDNGELIRPDYFSKMFATFLSDNELKHIRFHDLRHSYASLMLAKGKSLKTTSELLGHSTISITGDIYAHVIDEVK